ncbi:MAG: hypothetical protein N4A57_06270 [Anaeromicrobium sp.]|jgi:lysylphosphatidylglycerol synthetase-like protein (DUF2156 family)|uniref:hypothetical protein n=1 Tax=Anaeromicrobium sp. TaxID=1929132 RepID=UPI0025D5FE47|nr:hypothetical protein [Anaeromicrobium sp.]MCT4593858.1 hypothetical protein [Anaeromicrobium sp.]
MDEKNMKDHIKIIGIAYMIYSGLGLAIVAFMGLFASGLSLFSGDMGVILPITALSNIVVVILLIVSLPGILGGYYLMKGKNWARILVIVLSLFNLANFPLGTILGAYSIYILLIRREWRFYFK